MKKGLLTFLSFVGLPLAGFVVDMIVDHYDREELKQEIIDELLERGEEE